MVKIGRYCEPGMGSVNTYWVEGPSGVIVIDGQRELSKARSARERVETIGKPVLAVFVTHPHPDHFGGIGEFARGAPVYASRQTRESIASDDGGWRRRAARRLGTTSPRRRPCPTTT